MRIEEAVPAIPGVPLYDLLFGDLSVDERDLPAFVDGPTGAVTTYGQLVDAIDAFAGALSVRGIGVGDVVALHAVNSAGFAIAFHGILRAGATATTVNALFTPREIEKQLRMSRAVAHVTVSPLAPGSVPAAQAAGIADDRIVVLDGWNGFLSLAQLLAEGSPALEIAVDSASGVAVIPFSSGTTGVPKGVMLSHRNLVANVQQCVERIHVEPGERVLAVLPFFHIYGMTVLLDLAVRVRATLVTMPRFDLTEFLRVIQDEKVSYAFIAPPIAVALAKHPLVDEYDLSSLRTVFSGAAPLDERLGHAVADRLGVEVLQGYGMTELSPVSHAMERGRSSSVPLSSIGPAVPGTEVRIVDIDTLDDIEAPSEGRSASGELWVRGPQVMLGYLDNPEATAGCVTDDGWLRTGDIAAYDADGFVFIVDRLKELIKHKGYQVAPAELEALLLASDRVADAAVVGETLEDGDEAPVAFIVPVGDADEEAILTELNGQVAPYKKVRRAVFVDAIPKSASGKILRKDLKATLVGGE
ncbi:AMP-binding protein [Microbacterium gilvum]|uniref:4-coumarate--CoA ligase family protein n=1 Tax=Microbacterium gilvum TaxID=1336204 RepID=A0ABP9AKB2_9MICO